MNEAKKERGGPTTFGPDCGYSTLLSTAPRKGSHFDSNAMESGL